MKELQKIMDENAQNYGWKDWAEMQDADEVFTTNVKTVARKYAEAALKEAADRAQVEVKVDPDFEEYFRVDRQSILSIIKELK